MSNAPALRDRKTWEQLASQLRPEGRAFIDGKLVAARSGQVFEDVSPIDGRVICQVARGGAADIDAAVAAARASFEAGVWRRRSAAERRRTLLRFAELLRADVERLALLESLDVGKPIRDSLAVDAPNCASCIAYYGELADKLYDQVAPTAEGDVALILREPLGVVAAIVPWN